MKLYILNCSFLLFDTYAKSVCITVHLPFSVTTMSIYMSACFYFSSLNNYVIE